jgi:hypothetical protein
MDLNDTTYRFLQVTYQLSSISEETGMLLLRRKKEEKL